MTVRVGINGFGRIGRNLFRAATSAARTSTSSPSTTSGRSTRWPTCSSTTRSSGSSRTTIKATKDGIKVDDDELQVLSDPQPRRAAVGRARRRPRRRVDRPLHRPRQGRRAPRRRRPARRRVGPVRRRRRHVRDGRQPHRLRPQGAQGRLQRQLHDELLRADGQGARRRVRRRAGPDDDDPRLHRRPDARRRPAQGPAPGPRRGDQHRADEHRRRPRDVARAGVDEGQARRHVAARPRADRLDHRLQRHPRQAEATVAEINAAFAKAARPAR